MKGSLLEKNITGQIVFEKLEIADYEDVFRITEKESGLIAYIAIHDTTLGPALGGTRIFPYASEEEALTDVLRLARGMTYKSSIAQVGLGGGKSVIIADPKREILEEKLKAFGRAVDSLQGRYICAEDVGCTTRDVLVIRKETPFVVGLPHAKSSGDPGFFTAWGVFRGIQATVKKQFGTDSLVGKKIAVQGLGNVGKNLVHYLFWAGADLIVSDLDAKLVQKIVHQYGARAVSPQEIMEVECDVFAPCAMGGILNDVTIPKLRCSVVAGGANNQLFREEDGDLLSRRKILYAPDFVINAGGLINVAEEIEESGYSPKLSQRKCHQIYDALLMIYEMAEQEGTSTHKSAVLLAEKHIQNGAGKRKKKPVFHHESTENERG